MSVNIGTPLTPRAKKVLLCGAGELGKEVTIELQRLGVEVIAVDRYANAPAMQVAHSKDNRAGIRQMETDQRFVAEGIREIGFYPETGIYSPDILITPGLQSPDTVSLISAKVRIILDR